MLRRAVSIALVCAASASAQRQSPTAYLDSAIDRMGGAARLSAIRYARLEYVTQWMRTSFDIRPFGDVVGSYEINVDLRDYSTPGWRNTRRTIRAGAPFEIVNVVSDSAAAIRGPTNSWSALSAAYLDERKEVFTYSPERVLLVARAASDLKMLSDTTIAGTGYRRLTATLAGMPTTLLFDRDVGLLAAVQYWADQPLDFGLAPWGRMPVDVWYSRWSRSPGGIAIPANIDIARVGRPYKRLQIMAADFATAIAPDSFAISDSLRQSFFRTQNRAMHDLPIDSARIIDGRFAEFRTPGTPFGAIRLGDQWWLLEGGTAPMTVERASRWLADHGGKMPSGVLVTFPSNVNGGLAWAMAQKVDVRVAAGAEPFVKTILANHDRRAATFKIVKRRETIVVAGDTAIVEPIALPDAAGSLLVYLPRERWLYLASPSPLHLEYALARARTLGWAVERYGSSRAMVAPLPPAAGR